MVSAGAVVEVVVEVGGGGEVVVGSVVGVHAATTSAEAATRRSPGRRIRCTGGSVPPGSVGSTEVLIPQDPNTLHRRASILDRLADGDDLEVAFRRIALGARLVGLGWMTVLVVLALASGTLVRPVHGWILGGAAVAWGLASLAGARRRLDVVTARGSVTVDIVLAGYALFAPRLAGAPDQLFYGGYPLIVVAVAAVRSRKAVTAAAAVLSGLSLARLAVGDVAGVVEAASQVITYTVGAAIFWWVLEVLRRSEGERRAALEAVADARARAARAEERAEVATHLHDSVLQTLALIQRRAADAEEVAALARSQERELRRWLFEGGSASGDGLAEGLRAIGAEIEDRHRVRVEVVTVGDAPFSPTVAALLAATREAIVNAARHSGEQEVAVFAEVAEGRATVYVRDRGRGFDPASVPADRRGLAESIVGRIERVGGRVEVISTPGRGTEVRLEVSP